MELRRGPSPMSNAPRGIARSPSSRSSGSGQLQCSRDSSTLGNSPNFPNAHDCSEIPDRGRVGRTPRGGVAVGKSPILPDAAVESSPNEPDFPVDDVSRSDETNWPQTSSESRTRNRRKCDASRRLPRVTSTERGACGQTEPFRAIDVADRGDWAHPTSVPPSAAWRVVG